MAVLDQKGLGVSLIRFLSSCPDRGFAGEATAPVNSSRAHIPSSPLHLTPAPPELDLSLGVAGLNVQGQLWRNRSIPKLPQGVSQTLFFFFPSSSFLPHLHE